MQWLRNKVRDFVDDASGVALVYALVVMTVLLGAAAVGADASYAIYIKSRLQTAADSAALAGAALVPGNTGSLTTAEKNPAVNEALLFAVKNMPIADHGNVLLAGDVEFGFWDTEGDFGPDRKFYVEGSVPAGAAINAVRTTTRRAATNGNPLNMFMSRVLGRDFLDVSARAIAMTPPPDVEIALALDVSTSMSWNSPTRISLLKPAAKSFIDAVIRPEGASGLTIVSLIPFATQVSAGADLLGHFTTTGEHAYSHCVTFDDSDFQTTEISPDATLTQTGHFWAEEDSTDLLYQVCPPASHRAIAPWSRDGAYLKQRINDLEVYGYTSIEIAAKWGAAMLDPSLRPVLNAMVDDGDLSEELRDLPADYNRFRSMKVLVLMSDGENTDSWDIKAPYRSGPSTLYDYTTERRVWSWSCRCWRTQEVHHYSYYHEGHAGSRKYYSVDDRRWRSEPDGGSDAVQMTWPEVWNEMPVKYFTDNIKRRALGGSSSTYYNEIVDHTEADAKNLHTSQICSAAKAAGVTIFTIGMDTYGQGDATLLDCASDPTHFYDVESLDIATAFASIARQINQLRLTQ